MQGMTKRSGQRVISGETWEVLRLQVGPYGNNAYVLMDTRTKCAAIVDAPFEPERIVSAVLGHRTVAILLTHAHPDHVQALDELRKATGAPVGLHPMDPGSRELAPEIWLKDGQHIPVGGLGLQVLHTPGHTPGSVTLVLEPHAAFCGDTVFPGGPGRTWSPQGFQEILRSLELKIYTLPPGLLLLPGHGEGITVGESWAEYQVFLARGPHQGLWGEIRWDGF